MLEKGRGVPGWVVLLTVNAALFWLLFMVVHEGGHVLGAWATGGRVTRVVLSPVALNRTDVSPTRRRGWRRGAGRFLVRLFRCW
jgi:hypothetical protein